MDDHASEQHGKHRGLRFRLLLSTVTIVVLILLISITVFIAAISNSLYSTLRSDLVSRVNATTSFFNKYANSSYSELYTGARRYIEGYEDKNLVELQILSPAGRVMFSTSNLASGMIPSTGDLETALSQNTISVWRGVNPASGESVMAVSEPIVFPGGDIAAVVRCVSSLKTVNYQIFMYTGAALLVAIFIITFVVISNSYFARLILTPLAQINDTALLISKGRYGVNIDPVFSDEIGELCSTINTMSDAISRAEKMKNDFISSVSHELRTPLTAIGGWSETLLSGSTEGPGGFDDPEEVKKGLTIIKSEATRLTRMVEELLDFSRMESGGINMQMERIDILPEIEEVVFMYMDTLANDGMKLEYDEDDELPQIIGDRGRLKQVFFNILDNALKYGRDGRRIHVSAKSDQKNVVVRITDFGAGIAPEELPLVKNRFYKGSSKARGSGIGLAVADEIVKLHGGRLDIESKLGEGTTVTITLPVAVTQ